MGKVQRATLIREDGEGTVLTFTHSGLSERNARGFVPGTHAFFDRMEAFLDGLEPPAWQDRYNEAASTTLWWSVSAARSSPRRGPAITTGI